MRFVSALVATIAVLGACGPVLATESGPHSVKSGVQTIVLSYGSYNPDTCNSALLPVLRVVKEPAHGSVAFSKYAHKISKGPCEGKMLKSSAVAYRSSPGFRGRDEMIVEANTEIYIDGRLPLRSDQVRIIVDVK